MRSRARIVRHDGASVLVVAEGDDDTAVRVPLSRRVSPEPVVGDWVTLDEDATQVLAVESRRSLLRRRAAGGDGEQPLAANVDVVLLVCGLDRPVRTGRIQRGATLAWDAGAVPVVVLTKAAAAPGVDLWAVSADIDAAMPGIDVLVTSVREGAGLDALTGVCRDRTVTLLGESGSGKSSIVNALLGRDVASTGAVRSGDAKGRHTTTARELHALPGGGSLIDTPGIREVGLWVDPDAVQATFADVDDLAADCRFADCRHDGEPGCAVVDAVDPARLEAWRRLRREADAAALRADPRELRRRGKQFSRIAKEAQKRKGRA